MLYYYTVVADVSPSFEPIDILFYGNINSHRNKIKAIFMQLAKDYNLRVEFYTRK